MKLNQYLKKKRKESGLKQIEVAEQLGYTSAQFVSNWERGLASPPYDTLNQLIKMYKIPPQELIDIMLKEQKKKLIDALKPSLKKNAKSS